MEKTWRQQIIEARQHGWREANMWGVVRQAELPKDNPYRNPTLSRAYMQGWKQRLRRSKQYELPF